jgi:hypothetical protein
VADAECTFDGWLGLLGPQAVSVTGDPGYPEPACEGDITASGVDTTWEGAFDDLYPDVYNHLVGSFSGPLSVVLANPTSLDCTGTFDLVRQ